MEGQQAEWGSRASLQEMKDHRRQLAVLAVLHAEDLFGMCPKWTGSETPGVHHDFTSGLVRTTDVGTHPPHIPLTKDWTGPG